MDFTSLHIVHPNLATSNRMRRWLHLVAGFLLLLYSFQLYRETQTLSGSLYFILLVVAICFVAASFHANKLFANPTVNMAIRFLCTVTFFLIGSYFYKSGNNLFTLLFVVSGISYGMLGLTQNYILSESLLKVNKEGLQVPGTLKYMLFPWVRIRDVIHKDGWITVLFANNRYLQFQLTGEDSDAAIAEFLGVCRRFKV